MSTPAILYIPVFPSRIQQFGLLTLELAPGPASCLCSKRPLLLNHARRVWLLELSKSLPPTARLSGFDISAAQFPPSEWLPPNLSFDTLDAFSTVPSGLIGQFDIVHLRMLIIVVQTPEMFTTLIRNAMSMLSRSLRAHDLPSFNPQPISFQVPLLTIRVQSQSPAATSSGLTSISGPLPLSPHSRVRRYPPARSFTL